MGELLDSQLSLENQLAAVARNAFAQFQLVHQLWPYLNQSNLAMVVHALVTSKFNYCNTFYVGLPIKIVRKLQLVQNATARAVTRVRRTVSPLLWQLH